MTRIVSIADLHGQWQTLDLGKDFLLQSGKSGESLVLVIAGDTFQWKDDLRRVEQFNKWLGTLPFENIVIIPGNNDQVLMEHEQESEDILTHAIYLRDELVTIDGISFYGTPWIPSYGSGGAFMLAKDSPELKAKRDQIPTSIKIDVLITHGPPKMILDRSLHHENLGCALLREKLVSMPIKPRLHVFGHVHAGYGKLTGRRRHLEGITFVNAALCDHEKRLTGQPICIKLK